MNDKNFRLIAGIGCGIGIVVLLIAIPVALLMASQFVFSNRTQVDQGTTAVVTEIADQPTPFPEGEALIPNTGEGNESGMVDSGRLNRLYNQLTPGVVSIRVSVIRAGTPDTGAGSGFVFNEDQGYIITNNHVVAGAGTIIVVFYEGTQAPAELIGTDDDSDLAVIQVDEMPDGVHELPLGDSDQVMPGDEVLAIGNPFALNSSMTFGIVSAVGRTIPSGATPFAIPEAIQTDAAINPGNSGGPLLNLQGQVIGVNAQIATGGVQANAGVGFAIPANIVRRVAPGLIKNGAYQWPWLGVRGHSVGLLVQEENDLDTQFGAYLVEIIDNSPAAKAGLQGSTDVVEVDGLPIPVGGDVVVEADGQQIRDYSDLQILLASKNPGDQLELTIIRDGERQQITVSLEPRPENLQP